MFTCHVTPIYCINNQSPSFGRQPELGIFVFFPPQSIKTYSAAPKGLALIHTLSSLNAEKTKVFKPLVYFKAAIMF